MNSKLTAYGMINRARLLGLLVGCLVVILVTPALAERDVSKSGKASATGMVYIENIAGSVVVEGWNREEISVEGTLDRQAEKLIFKTGDKKSKIKVDYPRRVKTMDGSDLVIKVPRGSSLEIECVSASIEVDKVSGAVEAASVSGDVIIEGQCEEVEAESVSGRVMVRSSSRHIAAASISGRVEVSGDEAEVEAQTVSGSLNLTCETFLELSVESVSGSADVEGDLARGGTFKFDLHSGDLHLLVPADVSAEFEVETFSGDIDNAFGKKAHRTSKYAPGKELEFSVGGGDARVRINSFSGNVIIDKM